VKGRANIWLVLMVCLAVGLGAAFVVLAKGALERVERASQDKARTLARTVIYAMKGVTRYGPDQEGRVYGILEEVSLDPEVVSVGIARPDGRPILERGDPLPDLGRLEAEERLTVHGDRLVLIAPFEVESGCMAPGSCQCGGGTCSCGAHVSWAVPPGSYRLAIVLDTAGTGRVRATIVAEAVLAVGILAGLIVVAGLLARSLGARERLSRDVALEQQRRRSLESLGLLAAGLAHEIRNPLGAIRGYAQLMHEQAQGETRQRTGLMLGELDRVGERLEEFLGFARKRRLVVGPVDLGEIAREAASLLGPDAEASGITLAVEAPEPVVIDGDRAQLKELMTNLVLNAVDACAREGRIAVRAARGPAGAEVTVTDTGRGIRAEDLPHVFEPYFTTKETGSGLGLAISRRIAEDHGAVLTVENAPSGGAVARLAFVGREVG